MILTTLQTKKEIEQLTQSLMQYTAVLEKKFNDTTIKPENTSDFFNYVKTETEPIFALVKKWEALLAEESTNRKMIIPENIILSTNDNMTALIMHSFYKDVRRRRYMEIKRSCLYTYQSVLKELDDE